MPFSNDGKQLVRYLRDPCCVHLDPVHLLHRPLDVPRGRPLRIQEDDLVFDLRDVHLVFLHYLRLVLPVPVPGHRQIDLPLAARDRLPVPSVDIYYQSRHKTEKPI